MEFVHLDIPDSKLPPTSRLVSIESSPIDSGRDPDSKLFPTEILINFESPAISVGIVPIRLLSTV